MGITEKEYAKLVARRAKIGTARKTVLPISRALPRSKPVAEAGPLTKPTIPQSSSLICDVTVPGEPRPKGRPKVRRDGHVYYGDHAIAWEKIVRDYLAIGVRGQADARHAMTIKIHFTLPTRQRKDLDNLVKLVLDAANGVIWKDDVQVETLIATLQRDTCKEGSTRILARRGRVIVGTCAHCGSDCLVAAVYCSKKCHNEAQRKGEERRCLQCHKPFTAAPSASMAGYCSPQCWYKTGRVEVSCERCQKPFECYRSNQRRWCSEECRTTDLTSRPITCRVKGICVDCGAKTTHKKTRKGFPSRCRACFLKDPWRYRRSTSIGPQTEY